MSDQQLTDQQLWALWKERHPNPSGRSAAQRLAHRLRGGQPLPPAPVHHAPLSVQLVSVGLPPIKWIPSPNYFPNRSGHNPTWTAGDPNTWIVCHTQVGWMASTIAAFQSVARQASANYLVGLNGAIVQMVRETDGPWTDGTNVGVGSNLDSITIEFEDGGNYNGPRTPAMYEAGAQLIADIHRRRGIPLLHRRISGGVIGHKECTNASTACPDSLNFVGMIARAIVINTPPKPVPPPVPPDTRPEWQRNLKSNPQRFVLIEPVTIRKMATGSSSGTMVPVGALDVSYETSVGGAQYWVTNYGATPTVGNGMLKTEVEAALAPTPPVPVPVPVPPTPAPVPPTPAPPTPEPPPGPVKPAGFDSWITTLQSLIDFLKGLFGSKPTP